MRDYSSDPEVTVTTIREAMLWAGEHSRQVLYLASDDETAQRVKSIIRDRLGRRSRLVRVELAASQAQPVLGGEP